MKPAGGVIMPGNTRRDGHVRAYEYEKTHDTHLNTEFIVISYPSTHHPAQPLILHRTNEAQSKR